MGNTGHYIQCVCLRVDPGQKDVINKNAFEKFRKEHSAVPVTVDNAAPSERFEGQSVSRYSKHVSITKSGYMKLIL